MDSFLPDLSILFACLALSFFFSGSEVAFFSLKAEHLKKMSRSTDFSDSMINRLLGDPQRLLVTILLMNNAVNVTAAIITANLTASLLHLFVVDAWVVFTVEIVALTFTLLVLTEITPKILGTHISMRYASAAAPVFIILDWLIGWWLVKGIILSTSWLKFSFHSRGAMSGNDVKTIADVAHEHGSLEEKEREMITSLAGFSEKTVREIMVTRMDMVAIPDDSTFQEVLDLVRENGHSRIPVYSESIDHITGILYAKDLIPFLSGDKKPEQFDLTKLTRNPLYTPEGKRIHGLLKDFQNQRMHIGIVVDEYGGTAGLVTMDDVIGEIIGDFPEDEPAEEPLIRLISPGVWQADGKISIGDMEAELKRPVTNDGDFETLAGYLLNALGAIPKEKSTIRKDGMEFTIEKMEGRRIALVRISASYA